VILHRRRVGGELHVLHILGDGQMRDAAFAKRRAAGAVGDNQRVAGAGHLYIVERDLLHQRNGVEALLEAGADQIVKGQAGDGDDRRAVELRVVKAEKALS
jgi:hypothetical protein